MPPVQTPATRSLFAHRPFFLYFWGRGLSEFCTQIGSVVVGWQVYTLSGSAFALGLVGFAQFIPSALLTFVAGHVADRYDRRRVMQLCQVVEMLTAAWLALGNFGGWLTVQQLFAAVFIFGCASAFEGPATAALLPSVTPQGQVQQGSTLSTGAFQLAIVCGPALGGLASVISPALPYAAMAFFWILAAVLNGAIAPPRTTVTATPPPLSTLFAGVGFIRRNPALLGTISLDLFAVLLGGATALMPIYARDVLHVGPVGLGILRGAPAVGALTMTAILARHAIHRRIGLRMFQAVIVFGLATIVFALSHRFWMSLVALAIMGAADTISMVIRASLVQLATPDDMRGRVGAVNFLFINASSQLGEFESGMTAALVGAMPAAVLGGVATVAVALLWMKLFPALRDVQRLE